MAPPKRSWSTSDIGDLSGSVALVTGANSGIGFETALALARHGSHVVLGCRNPDKAQAALTAITNSAGRASAEVLDLDLSDLVSVRRAAQAFTSGHDRLDLLINNAGVMGTPYRQTADGFELQMATNHLGHFALTGLLFDVLTSSGPSRVVTVSSQMHRIGAIDFSDVRGDTVANTWRAYGASKLANLLFVAELSRRLTAAGSATIALAAHPGWTRSNLAGTGASVGEHKLRAKLGTTVGHVLGQSAATGALPSLYAATADGVSSGQFYGPRYCFELFGPPKAVHPGKRAKDVSDQARLWEASEALTDVHYGGVATH